MVRTRGQLHPGFAARAVRLLAILGLMSCGREEEVREPATAETEPQLVVPGAVELEKALPITAEDVGDVILVSGTAIGKPAISGFFLQTAGNRVLFVESNQAVTVGQRVRAAGPLRVADKTIFKAWERDILAGSGAEKLIQLFYIDADSVVPGP